MNDKEIERERYDKRAQLVLSEKTIQSVGSTLKDELPATLYAPYRFFQNEISKRVTSDQKVLEIGAGSGIHTEELLATGAFVTATDISEASLQVLRKQLANAANLETQVADMESLPFTSESFDAVVCAGSLSYGNNQIVLDEIYRVLRGGGVFIAVDSLNHNPVYRINRWVHYLRGERTRGTLKNMPTVSLIEAYGNKFGAVEAQYFGAISWLIPLLEKMIGERMTAKCSDVVDKVFCVKKSAFKFVMVASKILEINKSFSTKDVK